jgi:hypothetical protein
MGVENPDNVQNYLVMNLVILFLNGECDRMLKGISLHSHTFPYHKGSAFGCLLALAHSWGAFLFFFYNLGHKPKGKVITPKQKLNLGVLPF